MSAQPPYRTCAVMLMAYVTNSLKRLLGTLYVLYVFTRSDVMTILLPTVSAVDEQNWVV